MAASAAGETLLGPGPHSSRWGGSSGAGNGVNDGYGDVIAPRLIDDSAPQQHGIPRDAKSPLYVLE
jgi:hypothetical protein